MLVGKGITFDTGGISIKPGEAMANMKRDMTGGGAVIATMAALGAVGCPVPVIGLVAAAENSISGGALRPGDVIRHWGGRTTEVTNTDAEGRLVMADALAYAVAELDPAVVVDIATLTGAIKVALGQQVGGLFANDDALAAALLAAGTASGEPVWRMPAGRGVRGQDRLADRRRRQRRRRTGRDRRRTVPPALRRRGAVGAPRHCVDGRLARGSVRVEQGPHRLRGPAAPRVARRQGPPRRDRKEARSA